jgi:hypothetical protein
MRRMIYDMWDEGERERKIKKLVCGKLFSFEFVVYPFKIFYFDKYSSVFVVACINESVGHFCCCVCVLREGIEGSF